MKNQNTSQLLKQFFILFIFISFCNLTFAQDTDVQEKKERKARSSFKISAGANFNDVKLDSQDDIKSNTAVGYNLGISYKRGRFFYYEIGARYNERSFKLKDESDPANIMTNSLSVSALDVPLTAGVNLTSFADRLIGLRVFIGGVPSFTISKDVSEVDLEESDIQSFVFYGQAGIGIDITFFFLEFGYNYGFNDIAKDNKSTPSQAYVNLGFRF